MDSWAHPRVSDSASLGGRQLRTCISHELSGNAAAADFKSHWCMYANESTPLNGGDVERGGELAQ